MRCTLGGQNLHDEDGRPQVWAAVMFWTEAYLPNLEKLGRVRRLFTRLHYKGDPSMVLGLSRWRFVTESVEFHRAHPGHPEVTPMRGTLVVRTHTRLRPKRRQGFLVSHRINGSEPDHRPPPPYVPGEDALRAALYDQHYQLDAGLAGTLMREHRRVVGAGDYNRHGGRVWPPQLLMDERGNNPDRVAASPRVKLGPIRWLPKHGSDHPGWVVTARGL